MLYGLLMLLVWIEAVRKFQGLDAQSVSLSVSLSRARALSLHTHIRNA